MIETTEAAFGWPLPVRGEPYQRPAPELLAAMEGVSAATACAILHRMGVTRTAILGPRPLRPGQRTVGAAVTLLFMPRREDIISGAGQEFVEKKTALWHVFDTVEPSDVLVVQAYGSPETGCLGEMLVTHFQNLGGNGIIVDGCVRDAPRLRDLRTPIWCTGSTPHFSSQTELFPWAHGTPIACGKVLVLPGDIIIADDDGAVVVPAKLAAAVIEQAQEHESWEAFSRERITAGGSLNKYYPMNDEAEEEFEQWRRRTRG
jgi:regulator of RNase E activity RraA